MKLFKLFCITASILLMSGAIFADSSTDTKTTKKRLPKSKTVSNGTSAFTINSDSIKENGANSSNNSYSSTGDNENALRIDGVEVKLDNISVTKNDGKSSDTENGDFYGQNAALLAENGATVSISNANISSSAVNGNGVFSYGKGTSIVISDSVIRTTMRNSGGIQTTGGASMTAVNLDVVTQGNSAAAIRSDRGGGTVVVTGGTYESNGTGSPAIYSTADISVKNAVLTSNNSEAAVVEGKNSISLDNCTLTGNWKSSKSADSGENARNIMIYQSMSGDAEVGHATFSAKDGSITSKNGSMFYVTNTSCTISLENVKLNMDNDTLLDAAGNNSSRGWGKQGANGGKVTLITSSQELVGKIAVDKISTLDAKFQNNTVFTGSINPDGSAGDVNITLDGTSTWTLTADSYITTYSGSKNSINTNGFSLYVNGKLL